MVPAAQVVEKLINDEPLIDPKALLEGGIFGKKFREQDILEDLWDNCIQRFHSKQGLPDARHP